MLATRPSSGQPRAYWGRLSRQVLRTSGFSSEPVMRPPSTTPLTFHNAPTTVCVLTPSAQSKNHVASHLV